MKTSGNFELDPRRANCELNIKMGFVSSQNYLPRIHKFQDLGGLFEAGNGTEVKGQGRLFSPSTGPPYPPWPGTEATAGDQAVSQGVSSPTSSGANLAWGEGWRFAADVLRRCPFLAPLSFFIAGEETRKRSHCPR